MSAMTGWIIFAVYASGYAAAARKVAMWMISDSNSPDDNGDKIFCRVLGCLAAVAWPLILIGALITGRLPKSPREIRRQIEARDARIRELERELGIPHASDKTG